MDGDSHLSDEQQAEDAGRAEALRRMGVTVLSVPAWAVGEKLTVVVSWITAEALKQPARTAPARDADARA